MGIWYSGMDFYLKEEGVNTKLDRAWEVSGVAIH
jgi:hypothetical protein